MPTKYSLISIPTIVNRKIFFDSNVLIYLFWPSGSYAWETTYSRAFGQLIRQQNEMVVDFIVISEVINRSHRLEYEKYLTASNVARNQLSFKQYRDSTEGQSALSDIHLIIETSILNRFTIIGKSFTKEEIQSFLTLEPLDFNDNGILLTCKENDCILLTNDKDYRVADIEILTSNPAILNN